jgi:hypothetical protein
MSLSHIKYIQEQDQNLDEINEVADRLKIGSKNISNELYKH